MIFLEDHLLPQILTFFAVSLGYFTKLTVFVFQLYEFFILHISNIDFEKCHNFYDFTSG